MHCSSFVVVALLRGLPSAPVYICTLATNTGVGAFGTQVAKHSKMPSSRWSHSTHRKTLYACRTQT
jgi:hypothetical protein